MSTPVVEGVKAHDLGELAQFEGTVSWLRPDQHDAPPLDEPGIIVVESGGGQRFMAVRDARFRPGGETARQVPGVHTSDLGEIVNAIVRRPYVIQDRKRGIEAELNIVTGGGDPFNLYEDGRPVLPGLEEHPELWNNTAEIITSAELSITAAYGGLRLALTTLHKQLLKHGAHIDPAAARMQDTPGRADTTPHPYVQMFVDNFGPDILQFMALGIHEHYDVHVGHLPIVSRYLRVVAPYLNLGLLAAPFGFGQAEPGLGDILDNDELRAYDGQQIQSTRYPNRFASSASGGVGLWVAHDTVDGTLTHADDRLHRGEVNHVSRHTGIHADVRDRLDPPVPGMLDHPGRAELCVKDTSVLRIGTLTAYAELTAALIRRLDMIAAEGEEGIDRLHQEYPDLFGPSTDVDTFASTQLERAHLNSLAIAYQGSDAIILDGRGEPVRASVQLTKLTRFATEGGQSKALSVGVGEILRRSAYVSDAELHRVMRQYTDEHGRPSLHGYYKTGYGTPAQWMRAHYEAAREQGFNEADSLRLGTQDRVRAFTNYITSLVCTVPSNN